MVATIILLALILVNLGIHLAKHGEPREDKYNFWLYLIATIIELVLYYYAGLFENFTR